MDYTKLVTKRGQYKYSVNICFDLRDEEHPIIHVRTWQPNKDPDFRFFDLSKFTIN